ncbi:protein INCA1 isoform 1-T3 [Anomaloglossus baeobatrachus]|uniref:protein INCA1 n=1 Tax=Anomaloglossus baeobatrachus TaxID=238106 RepID=UPI003F50981F
MYDEFSNDNYIPYITRSRTVSRLLPEPILPHSPLLHPEKRYGPEFWDRLLSQPTSYNPGIPGAMSGYETYRTDHKWNSMAPPPLETLPHPSEIFKGNKKKKSPAERSVISVENYIQELRKKQSAIDQLKTMKWGGYNAYEDWSKEEIQSEGSRADQDQDTFFSFLNDDVGGGEPDMSIFSVSPPRSPGGAVFPWLSPQRDVSTAFMDRSYDGWGAAGRFF